MDLRMREEKLEEMYLIIKEFTCPNKIDSVRIEKYIKY